MDEPVNLSGEEKHVWLWLVDMLKNGSSNEPEGDRK